MAEKAKESKEKIVTPVEITKPIDIKESWQSKVSLALSIASIILSLLVAFDVFSSFNLEAYSSGAFVFYGNSTDNAYRPTPIQVMTFTLPIDFINTGAKPGIIEDMYMIVKHGEEQTRYTPDYEIDAKHFLDENTSLESYNKPFQQFGLSGDDKTTKNILFIGGKSGQFLLTAGEYQMDVFIKDSTSNEYCDILPALKCGASN